MLEDIFRDARIYLGLPPYNTATNITRGDPYFNRACKEKYGESRWLAALDAVKIAEYNR